jgi:aromatic ring-opening dioxygenase LigB subunit
MILVADKYTIKKTCFNNIEENTLVELYSLSKDSIKQVDNKSFHEVTILMSAIREEAPAQD